MQDMFNELLIFRNIQQNPVIDQFRKFTTAREIPHKVEHLFQMQYEIVRISGKKGISWKQTVLDILLMDENLFTLKCERRERIDENLLTLVAGDIHIIRNLYNYDWITVLEELSVNRSTVFTLDTEEFENIDIHSLLANNNIGERFIVKELSNYIRENGTGLFSKESVFKWDDAKQCLSEIKEFDRVRFEDLIGYEGQTKALKENTLSFIDSGKGNNVLLYGQRGTGKSSSVKALVNEYAHKGLKIIELKKGQLDAIASIIEITRHRDFKFILFIDDLSFEEFETDYKKFKAIIEGSFEKKPNNLLIYVTSNRHHLVRETFKEREEDVNVSETVQEKLSLFDRFGLTILYEQPKDDLYNEMVIKLARRNGIKLPEKELLQLANEWKVSKASKSGRAAQQLVDSLSSKL